MEEEELKEIEEKYPDFRVVPVKRLYKDNREFWGIELEPKFRNGGCYYTTSEVTSMHGFRAFVFMFGDYFLSNSNVHTPQGNYRHTCRPLAVLLSKYI